MGDPIKTPGDPIKDMHDALLKADLLNEDTKDLNVFRARLATPDGRRRLYDVMRFEGLADITLEEFNRPLEEYFSAEQKKNGGAVPSAGSGASSSTRTNAPAHTAGAPSDGPTRLDPFSPVGQSPARSRPLDPFSPVADVAESAGESAALGDDRPIAPPNTTGLDALNPSGAMGLPNPENRRIPERLTGNEDVLEAGKQFRRLIEPDFDAMEERANRTTWRRGQRDVEMIALYGQEAQKQVDAAARLISLRLGKDWQTEYSNYLRNANAQPENAAEAAYMGEARTMFQRLALDPNYKLWLDGQKALVKAKETYDSYAAANPKYAEQLAFQAKRMADADKSANTRWSNFTGKKFMQLAAGAISLPRTVLGTVANLVEWDPTGGPAMAASMRAAPAMRFAEAIGDAADQMMEWTERTSPTGATGNRPLWESIAPFEGKLVAVDDKGLPTRVYNEDGTMAEADATFERRFLQSGAASEARTRFTAGENLSMKLVDVVADLYAMRTLGGGTLGGTTAVAFTLQHQDAYKTAIEDLKLTGDDAAQYAMVSAGISALIEATVGRVEMAPIKLAAVRAAGLREAKALLGKASMLDVGKAAWKPYLREIGLENLEELADKGAQTMHNITWNVATGSKLNTDVTGQDLGETILLTTLATGMATGSHGYAHGKSELHQLALNAAVENPEAFARTLDELRQGEAITEVEANAQMARIAHLARIQEALPPTLTQEQRHEINALEDEKQHLQAALPAMVSEGQRIAAEKAIKAIDNKVAGIIGKDPATVAAPIEETAAEVLPEAAQTPEQNDPGSPDPVVAGDTAAQPDADAPVLSPEPLADVPQTITIEPAGTPAAADVAPTEQPVSTATAVEAQVEEPMPAVEAAGAQPQITNTPGDVSSPAVTAPATGEADPFADRPVQEELGKHRMVQPRTRAELGLPTTTPVNGTVEEVRTQYAAEEQIEPAAMQATLSSLKSRRRKARGKDAKELDEKIRAMERNMQRAREGRAAADEAFIDDATNLALGAMLPDQRRAVLSSDANVAGLRQFVAQELAADPNAPFRDTTEALGQEYARNTVGSGRAVSKRITDRFNPETVEDHIAAVFAEGVRLDQNTPNLDVADMNEGVTAMRYTSRNGTPMDILSDLIFTRIFGSQAMEGGVSDMRMRQIEEAIRDFINDNRTGPFEYIKRRIAEQENVGREPDVPEEFWGESVTPEEWQQATEAAVELEAQLTDEETDEVIAFFDNYRDENGVLDVERFIQEWDAAEPWDAPVNQLSSNAYTAINRQLDAWRAEQQANEGTREDNAATEARDVETQEPAEQPRAEGQRGQSRGGEKEVAQRPTEVLTPSTKVSVAMEGEFSYSPEKRAEAGIPKKPIGLTSKDTLNDIAARYQPTDSTNMDMQQVAQLAAADDMTNAALLLLPNVAQQGLRGKGSGLRRLIIERVFRPTFVAEWGDRPILAELERMANEFADAQLPWRKGDAQAATEPSTANGPVKDMRVRDFAERFDDLETEAARDYEDAREFLALASPSKVPEGEAMVAEAEKAMTDADRATLASRDGMIADAMDLALGSLPPGIRAAIESNPRLLAALRTGITITLTSRLGSRSEDMVRDVVATQAAKFVIDKGVKPKKEQPPALFEDTQNPEPERESAQRVSELSGMGGVVKELLSHPGAVLRRRRMDKRLNAARTLEERIAIAQAEHRISRDRAQKQLRRALRRLQRAFPNIEVVTEERAIDRVKAARGITGDVLGFVHDGKVYIDPRVAQPSTPIHEFGHVWNTWLKANRPKLYERGLTLARRSTMFQEIRNNPAYADLTAEEVAEEVLATAIGERGALIGDTNLTLRFRAWMNRMWTRAQAAFGFQPRFMTLEQFAHHQAVRMLGERNLITETSERIKELEAVRDTFRAQFGGEKGATQEMLDRLNTAWDMEEAGVEAEKVFYATGWFRGVDGKWRWAMDSRDVWVRLDNEAMQDLAQGEGRVSLRDILDFPGLYAAYPQAADIPVYFKRGSFGAKLVRGLSGESYMEFTLPERIANLYIVDTLLHEAQHYIQFEEGFARGTNPNEMSTFIDKEMDALASQLMDDTIDPGRRALLEAQFNRLYAYSADAAKGMINAYMQTAGEVEARAASRFAEERRYGNEKIFPPHLYEVAPEDQTILLTEAGSTTTDFVVPVRLQVGTPAANHGALLASAEAILQAEVRQHGIRDIDQKIERVAAGLGLDHESVARMWERAARDAGLGKIVLTTNDLANPDLTGKQKIARWLKRRAAAGWATTKAYFKPGGILNAVSPQIFQADQRRLGRVGARLKEAEYRMRDLDVAMKEEYGKAINDAHWQHVDNVLRGTGDWQTLPDGVREAAKAMRDAMDLVSQELVTSGVMSGDVILTVLNNSGVTATQEVLENWDGVNLYQALGKLPYERTDAEHRAIETFLARNNNNIGSYFYRSYRKYDDPDWAENVDPRVRGEARRFLEAQIHERIAYYEGLREEKVEDLERQIQENNDTIQALQDELARQRKAMEERLDEIRAAQASYTAEKGRVNLSLERQYAAAVKALKALESREADVEMAVFTELEAVMELTAEDMATFAVAAKRIVGLRRRNAELQQRQDDVENFKQEELDHLHDQLANVEGLIDEILYVEDAPSAQLSRSKLGSKDLKILRGRKDIPEEIRALMGEYRDPRVNFAKSMYRAVNLLENQRFLAELRENYAGVLFIAPDETRSGFPAPLSSATSPSLAPLNGWKTTPEIAKAINQYYARQAKPERLWEHLTDGYVRFQAAVKYGKTILSPVTHLRNFFGNPMVILANGHNPFTLAGGKVGLAFQDALQGTWLQGAVGRPQAETERYMQRLIELRVLRNGAFIGSIHDLLSTMNADQLDRFFNRSRQDKGFWTGLKEGIENLYGAEDDFFKIMSFELEKKQYAEAMYGRPFDRLTIAEQRVIEEKAAGIVLATTPTYSMIPEIVKQAQRSILTGTFVAFPAEMLRVSYNQWKQTAEDLRDPRTRHIGVKRAIGASMAHVALSAAFTAIGHMLTGFDWDKDEMARVFMFPWQRDGVLLYKGFTPGEEVSFVNTSYTDPFSVLKKPIVSGFFNYEKSGAKRFQAAGWELLQPFLSTELTTGTFAQLWANKSERTGKPIYNDRLGLLGDFKQSAKFIAWSLQPGVVKFGFDVYSAITGESVGGRSPKRPGDVAMGALGLQVERITLPKAAASNIRRHSADKMVARAIFNDTKWDLKDDPEALKARAELANEEYNRVLQETGATVRAAMGMGISQNVIKGLLKDYEFSADERAAILSGRIVKLNFEGYNEKTGALKPKKKKR